MKKRIILITIIGLLFLLMLPIVAGAEIVQSGTCGDNITWELDDAGNLSITGTGEMVNETNISLFPTDKVKKAVISNAFEIFRFFVPGKVQQNNKNCIFYIQVLEHFL